jgi:hypothetical protein
MMQLILGIGHKSRHGKDSFASAIENHYATQYYAAQKHGLSSYRPVIVQRHAFADALYHEVNEWLRINPEWAKDGKGPTSLPSWVTPDPNPEVSVRAPYGKHAKLLQWWGTEYRRSQDPLYWVKKWKSGINPKAQVVMATDMRFLNEAEAVLDLKGFTIDVSRLNPNGTNFIDGSRDPLHVSETQLDDYNFDYRIKVKTGDLVLLEEWAITLVHYLRALKGHK